MAMREKIQKLAQVKDNPSVSISINTHRTHPDNLQDAIVLKNALKEAEERILNDFDKKDITTLLEKINQVENEVDVNQNLESLHIFLSENHQEIIRSSVEIPENRVAVDDHFLIRPLLKTTAKTQEYLILFLSQDNTRLFEAVNDSIVEEIKNDDFPFGENPNIVVGNEAKSDGKKVDAIIKEHFNVVDKALLEVHHQTGLNCVVITTENNYSLLLEVANKPDVYKGYAVADYNNSKPHQLAESAWPLIQDMMKEHKLQKIEEVKEAIGNGMVLTELQDIYKAAIDGRGEVLIVHEDFSKPVRMTDERSFEVVDEEQLNEPDVIDDITTNIAWEVISKNGDVVFTTQEEIKDLGDIVLKTRY